MKVNRFKRLWRARSLWLYGLESVFWLAFAKLCIFGLPFRWWIRWCGVAQCETLRDHPTPRQREQIAKTQRAVRFSGRKVPWPSVCLDQALTVQWMLACRGIPSTLYLGMIKDAEGKWTAHAWMRSGPHWVIGYQPQCAYTVVGTYAVLK